MFAAVRTSVHLKQVEQCEDVDWINLAEDKDQWRVTGYQLLNKDAVPDRSSWQNVWFSYVVVSGQSVSK
jgi:hypothetical protein